MKLDLILPKNGVIVHMQNSGTRLYFLAGPIRGAGDWQAKAIKLLAEKDPGCIIACPCRYTEEHELFKYSVEPTLRIDKQPELTFARQTLWERHYLNIASIYGSVIFFLAEEDSNNPRAKSDGPYGRDTYGELGRWSMRSARADAIVRSGGGTKVNLVIGADPDFSGLSVIQANFDEDHGYEFPIYNTLEETISQAVTLAKKTNP